MDDKQKRAVELFAKGYNCAQAVIGVFCDDGLDVNTAFRLANGFGGGMRCGEVCGAVSGAVLAIGLKCGFHAEGDFERKGYCNKKTYEFIEAFTERHGSVQCRGLLGADIRKPDDHRNPEIQELFKTLCPKLVESAVGIVDGMDL
jgi:C_GCAxxG_C_C family probable redox protein